VSLKEQLAEYRVQWKQRVPAERRASIERHIRQLRKGNIGSTMLKVGDRAPPIVLRNAQGETVDVGVLLEQGPVIVTFYRGGWCPYCNLELRAFQQIFPEIRAAGASLVAISPEKPDGTLLTVEKNARGFDVLSDVGQKVGRAFGLVYPRRMGPSGPGDLCHRPRWYHYLCLYVKALHLSRLGEPSTRSPDWIFRRIGRADSDEPTSCRRMLAHRCRVRHRCDPRRASGCKRAFI
jgi:peroxiredoxin